MILQKREANIKFTKELFKAMIIWVRSYYLELELWNDETINAVSRTIDIPLELEGCVEFKTKLKYARMLIQKKAGSPKTG